MLRYSTPAERTATDSRRTAPGSRSYGTRLPHLRHLAPLKMPFLIDVYKLTNNSFNQLFNPRVPRWFLITHPARQRAPLRGNLDCASRTWKTQERATRLPVAAAHRRSASLLAVCGGGGPERAILAPSPTALVLGLESPPRAAQGPVGLARSWCARAGGRGCCLGLIFRLFELSVYQVNRACRRGYRRCASKRGRPRAKASS